MGKDDEVSEWVVLMELMLAMKPMVLKEPKVPIGLREQLELEREKERSIGAGRIFRSLGDGGGCDCKGASTPDTNNVRGECDDVLEMEARSLLFLPQAKPWDD